MFLNTLLAEVINPKDCTIEKLENYIENTQPHLNTQNNNERHLGYKILIELDKAIIEPEDNFLHIINE